MSTRFQFDDASYPVPQEAVDADPGALIRNLIYRNVELQRAIEEHDRNAARGLEEMLLQLVSLADDITGIVERYGITSSAKEAVLVRSVVSLGRKVLDILRYHGVQSISTVGELVDATVADVVGSEPQKGMPANRVLREVQVGYRWREAILRRAGVIVSASEAENPAEDMGVERESDASAQPNDQESLPRAQSPQAGAQSAPAEAETPPQDREVEHHDG